MKPLPADEQHPLADVTPPLGGGDVPENLILWLAYKEAKALIPFNAAPPRARNTRQEMTGSRPRGHSSIILTTGPKLVSLRLFRGPERGRGSGTEART